MDLMKNSGIYIIAGILQLLVKTFEFIMTYINPIEIHPYIYHFISFVSVVSFSLLFFSLTLVITLFNERKAIVYVLYVFLAAKILGFVYGYFAQVPGPDTGLVIIGFITVVIVLIFLVQSFLIRAKPIAPYFIIISCLMIIYMLFLVILPFFTIPDFETVYGRGEILITALPTLVILILLFRVTRKGLVSL